MNIFKYAMKLEKESEMFYIGLVKSSPYPSLKKIFLILANEEKKHYLKHNNSLNDQCYRNFLFSLVKPLKEKIMNIEVDNYTNYKEKERLDLLISLSQEIAPDLADYNSGQLISWSGFRPLTPSSFPIIGPSSKEGLYINSGQGFYGWTLACASGFSLANFF